jgi:hypothetical protein
MWNPFQRKEEPKRKYTVAADLHCNTPVDLDLTRLTFYSKHEDGSRGWATSPSGATPLTLDEADNVVSELGGVILDLKDSDDYLSEYWRTRRKNSESN